EKMKVVKPEVLNPLAAKLQKISELQQAVTQRKKVQEFKDSLLDFSISNEDEKMSLNFSDEARHRVETSNPYLIKTVVAALLSAAESKINELDSRLIAATI
ncbi:MAG: hypothetical protein ACEQSL_03575, partial [Sediminibacterium sp.]